MAMNHHGNGLRFALPDPARGALRLAAHGAIEAAFGLDEMGQGLIPAIISAVSARLGVAREDVRAGTGDTRAAPDSGPTTASRGTCVVWRAAELAAPRFVETLTALAGRRLSRPPENLRLAPGGFADALANSDATLLSFADLARALAPEERPVVEVAFEYPETDFPDGNARFLFVFGAAVARVAVDRVTGAVRVLDINQHAVAGPVLDIASFLGQQEGGAVQALGFALSEDALMQAGRWVTTNFDTYLMPTFADAPEAMRVSVREDLDAGDPFGPRGAGELGVGAVTPALVNAVADALGEASGEGRLIDFLRDEAGLTGAKLGCGISRCAGYHSLLRGALRAAGEDARAPGNAGVLARSCRTKPFGGKSRQLPSKARKRRVLGPCGGRA